MTLARLTMLFTLLLGSCASRPGDLIRPRLPDPPSKFGEPVELPVPQKGKSVKTFALQNRLGLIEANQRLENDHAFYEDVRRGFGQ